MDKFKSYITNESKLEQDSRFKVSGRPPTNNESLEIKRQKFRIYLFYSVIFFLFAFIIKSLVRDLTLFGVSGVNFFSRCKFP